MARTSSSPTIINPKQPTSNHVGLLFRPGSAEVEIDDDDVEKSCDQLLGNGMYETELFIVNQDKEKQKYRPERNMPDDFL